MSSDPSAQPPAKPKRVAGPRVFLTFNAVYLLAVYGASLWIHPLGADYANLASAQGTSFPVPLALIGMEARWFADTVPAYHSVNLVLLYATMVCLFFFTRYALRGPWWLGSLVAVLTMANPMKSEAVLRLTGVDVLWPMLMLSAALLALASHLDRPRVWKLALVHVFVLAGPAFLPAWRGAGVVLALYALLGAPETKAPRWAFLSFAIYSLLPPFEPIALAELPLAPQSVLGPLLLVFYPIGFLPETVARLEQHLWLAWLETVGMLVLAALLVYRTRDRGLAFALLGMLAFRLLQPAETEDLVHMAGGGRFLLPIALGSLAVAAIAQRVARHPKWARPVVMMTTLLCVIYFALQWREIGAWYHAAGEVRAYQQESVPSERASGYYRTAPLSFEEAIRHDTPFSRQDTNEAARATGEGE